MDNKRLDEAVEAYLQAECQAINGDESEYLRCDRDREIVRAALIASLPVLLGEPVAWAIEGFVDGKWHVQLPVHSSKEFAEDILKIYTGTVRVTTVYAPSLGEGE